MQSVCGFFIRDQNGSIVARVIKVGVPSNGDFSLPAEENARLIAASPKLLSALQDLLDVVTGQKEGDAIAVMNAQSPINEAKGRTE